MRRGCANTSNFALPGLPPRTALIALDLDGVMVSSGSACSSGKVAAIACAGARWAWPTSWRAARLRVSFGWNSSDGRCRCGDCVAAQTCCARSARGRVRRRMSSAAAETKEQVAETRREVQIRLRHRHRDGARAQGPDRRHGALHLGQEGRAGMDAGMAAGRLRALAGDERAELGARALSARSTTRTPITTPRRRTRR